MTSATEFENVGNQPPFSRINARWDAPDDELDNDNSSARLFERSRIKALAGTARGHGGQKVTATIPIRSMALLAMVSSLYVSSRRAVTGTPLPSSESTLSPGSTGVSSVSQNPPLPANCSERQENAGMGGGWVLPSVPFPSDLEPQLKCEESLGKGVCLRGCTAQV